MLKLAPKIFLISFFLILTYQKAFSTHVMGGDISFKYLGNSKYLVTVLAYRDCNGIFIGGSGLSANDNYTSLYLSPDVCCGKDITPICKNSCSRCISNSSCPFPFGIEQFTITGILDASKFTECNILIKWSESDGGNTTNIQSYDNSVYIESKLNRCNIEHSSPQFEFGPHPYLCVNQLVDEFVTATAGNPTDSIVYHLAPPLYGYKDEVPYNTSFSYLSPLTYSGSPKYSTKKPNGFHYDSITGEFYFKPTKLESSYITWEADEYLKDSMGKYYLAGTIMRTLEINITSCPTNSSPTISPPDNYSSDSIYGCTDIPITFSLQTNDNDKTDSVHLTINNETNGTISIQKGFKHPNVSFSWTPGHNDARRKPYRIMITGKDDHCPLAGYVQKSIYIFVKDSIPITGIKIIDSGCGKYHFGLAKPINKHFNLSYIWTFDTTVISSASDFSYKNNLAGKHAISLTINNINSGCSKTYYDTIYYDTAYQNLNKLIGICKGDLVPLFAAQGKNLQWSPSTYLTDSTIHNPIAKPDSNIIYTVSGLDSKGCTYNDQTKITVGNYKLITSGDIAICNGSTTKLFIKQVPGATVSWNSNNKLNLGTGDTLKINPHQTTKYYVIVNQNGCIKTDSINVTVNPTIFDMGQARYVCPNDSITMTVSGGKSYIWHNLAHPTIILAPDSFYTIHQPSNGFGYSIFVIKIDKITGCSDTGFTSVYVRNFKPTISSHEASICIGDSATFKIGGGHKYIWTYKGSVISSKSTISVSPDTSSTYHFTIIDTSTNCSFTDSVFVEVSQKSSRYPTVFMCKGSGAVLTAQKGYAYRWRPAIGLSDTMYQTTIARPLYSTFYTVLILDSKHYCSRVDTIPVFVDSDCVWPGDANKDKTVDYLDVLNIGVGYGNKGAICPNPSSIWAATPGYDWNKGNGYKINYKHFDCNGDGIIDAKDTSVITANYGKSHSKWTHGSGNPNDPPVYFKFAKDTFYGGDTAIAYLYAGSSTKPLKNAYGFGYQATYIAAPLVVHSENFSPFCDYFCSGRQLDYIKPDFNYFQFEGTNVKTDGLGSSNTYGKFAVLKFLLQDSVSFHYKVPERIYARLLSVTAIDSTGKEININGMDDSAIVVKPKAKKNGSGIEVNSSEVGLKIYPNPANNELIIEYVKEPISKLSIYNSLGQMVSSKYPNSTSKKIDVNGLSNGIYFIEIEINYNIYRQKFIIQR